VAASLDSTPRPLAAGDWLRAWERAQSLPPALRPCAWLAPLLDDADGGGQARAERLAVGRRDARLLALHAALFGPRLQAVAACPRCGERVEFELDTRTLSVDADDAEATAPVRTCHAGRWIEARLPDSRDLLALESCASEGDARALLVRRCVSGEEASTDDWSAELIDSLSRAMADADPQSVTELAVRCFACGHEWQEDLDIARFVAAAFDQWAEHLLDDVHMLASAYGWREADILALPAARRARYLARVQG
jgi:hypothetical protein